MGNIHKPILVDESILRDMVDIATLQALLESFGQICGVGAGIFAPDGTRIGEPGHHHPFCHLLYTTKEGKEHCLECDREKIEKIRKDKKCKGIKPYECHAGLIDFCEPIFCHIRGKRRLIGVFFAGQVLYEENRITNKSIGKIRKLAASCKVDADELFARYQQVPRLPHKRVDEIRKWMKHFTNLIGLLVERKAATQQLLLDVIGSADDPNTIVHAIQQHLKPAAVSIFLQRDDVPEKFADRIFLVATTSIELAERLSVKVEEDIEKTSYRPDEGLTGWVYKTRRVLYVPNVRDKKSYPQFPHPPEWKHKVKEIPDLAKTQAFLGMPIRSGDNQVVGVIRASRLKGDPGFKNDEIELLTGIASLVGAAVSTAQLSKSHLQKIEALKQAQGLLRTLTEPDTNLESITSNMVEQLGETYVKKGKWEAVYVLQHLSSSAQFRFVASFPPNLRKEFRGEPFPDTKGVAGHILHKTRKTFASTDCARDKVKPTTPWTSVVCAPIFHEEKMWGAVSLCSERKLSQTDVDLAKPKITQFAEDMSLVCRLSETLDAKNAATLAASNMFSLILEKHEIYNTLESSKSTVDHLYPLVMGEKQRIVEKLVSQIDDSLIWAAICLDVGKYIQLCQTKPDAAIETFINMHHPDRRRKKPDDRLEHLWEEISITKVTQKALNSVQLQIDTLKTNMKSRIMDGGFIVGDENMLYRVLKNLLENAIVHGSKIRGKEGKFKKGLKVFFSVTRNSTTGITKIIIQDKGVGMDPKILAASKEIYANPTLLGRTSLTPGIGTAIVAFAMSIHHGHVLLQSQQGKGTTVTIKIPSHKRKGISNEKNNYRR